MRKKILIIDDSVPVAEMVKQYLEETRKDVDIMLASDGEQGLEKVDMFDPDLVILDINMPGMDGIEVYKRLMTEKNKTKVPVVFLSIREELSGMVKEIGAVDFIDKSDFDYDKLTATIDKVFSG